MWAYPARAQSPSSSANAPASPASFSLNWVRGRGAESCISPQALAQKVENLLQRAVFFSAAEAELSIEAGIERVGDPAQWHARVVVSNASGAILGSRELQSSAAECGALNEPIAIIIALALDPEGKYFALPSELGSGGVDAAEALLAEISSQPRAETKPAEKEAKPANDLNTRPVAPSPKTGPNAAPSAVAPWRFEMGAGAAVSIGLLPNPGFALGLIATLIPGTLWPLELRANYWFDNAVELPSGSLVKFQITEAAFGVCPVRLSVLNSEIFFCGAVDAGAIRMFGKGFKVIDRDLYLLLAADVHGRLQIRLVDGLHLYFEPGLIVPLIRDQLEYRPAGDPDARLPLFRMSAVVGRADLGVGVRF